MSVRLLLVDDHEIFRTALRALLETEPDLEVVGHAGTGRGALEAAREREPDVILMDISMPDMNGIEAARQLCAEGSRVLCLSMHPEEQFVGAALRAGASGYLLKDCGVDELVHAIRTVAGGRAYLSPSIAGTVLEGYRVGSGRNAGSAYSLLSAREREVLQLLAEGHSSRSIASRLGVSVKTVGTHREHLMDKLGIHSVAGLTKYAVREGLTSSSA